MGKTEGVGRQAELELELEVELEFELKWAEEDSWIKVVLEVGAVTAKVKDDDDDLGGKLLALSTGPAAALEKVMEACREDR